jgi:hypothetical protein
MLLLNSKRYANGICLTLATFILLSAVQVFAQKSSKKPDPAKNDTAAVTVVKPEPPKLDDLLTLYKYFAP